jgi:hypothetical protein
VPLLIDTDSLLVLCALGDLDSILSSVGFPLKECRRLTAAPYQIRRAGWVRRRYPNLDREPVAQQVEAIAPMTLPTNEDFQARLARIDGIDGGEAMLLAAGEERRTAVLLSGDLRMLKAFGKADSIAVERDRLRGRLLYLPQIARFLARHWGLLKLDRVWRRADIDHKSFKILFGSQAPVSEDHFAAAYQYLLEDLRGVYGEHYLYEL